MRKTVFKTVSKRAKSLLKHEEGLDVEFKTTSKGLSNEDLVAFANSASGGSILIGVEETKAENGQQRGRIIGCDIGDEEKLVILNKAMDCIPPVDIEIFIENVSAVPFYRIEIPSGIRKPYSTKKGVYKIRGDGRNKSLYPSELLSIFMESEGIEFINRFKVATLELQNQLSKINVQITDEIVQLFSSLTILEERLGDIFGSTENAEMLADDAMAFSDETLEVVYEVNENVSVIRGYALPHLEKKIDALLEKLGIEDPVLAEIRFWSKKNIKRLYQEGFRDSDLIHELILRPPATMEDLRQWYLEVVHELEQVD